MDGVSFARFLIQGVKILTRTAIYELAVLYRNDSEEGVEKAGVKLKKLLLEAGAKILKEEVWGKRQLAYPVRKETHAFYVFYDLEMDCSQPAKLESVFNITEEILRYQFHKPDLKALAAALAQPSEATAVEAAPKGGKEDGS